MITLIKYLLSFLKNDWKFYDYPIQVKKQNRNDPKLGRYKLVTWVATITNWPQLFGGGETKEAALNMLKDQFDEYRQKNETLPRPGVHVPIVFASATEIGKHKLIARDFFKRVLNRDIDKCFISDKSSIWDFPEVNEQIHERIQQVYGVDISDITSGNFVQIFERLGELQVPNVDTLSKLG